MFQLLKFGAIKTNYLNSNTSYWISFCGIKTLSLTVFWYVMHACICLLETPKAHLYIFILINKLNVKKYQGGWQMYLKCIRDEAALYRDQIFCDILKFKEDTFMPGCHTNGWHCEPMFHFHIIIDIL